MSLLMTDANGVGGLAIARSIGKRGIEVTASSAREDAICFHSKYVKNKLIYPEPKDNGRFLKWLYDRLSSNKFDVFFPIDEPILLATAENIEKLSLHTHTVIPELDTLRTAVDKSKLTKFAIKNNIPVPKTYFYEELRNFNDYDFSKIPEEFGHPILIKPNTGSGAVGQVLVYNAENIGEIYRENVKRYGPCMIQEFVKGTKYLMSFIFNFNSQMRRVCIQKTLRQLPVSGGAMIYGVTVKNDDVLKLALKALKKLNYKSIGSMDFIIEPGDKSPKLLDFNPRFYGSVCFPIAAGVDFPYLVYKMALDGDIDKNLDYKVGVRCRFLFEDFKHLITILKNGKAENYPLSRSQTLMNFLKFYRDNGYYDWSFDDPKPFLSRPFCMVKRKLNI